MPAGVTVAPAISALTDHEMESILAAAADAGARWAGKVLLRLPHEVKDLFTEWLTVHAPLKARHVMALVRASRDGQANDPRFGSRMRGTGAYAAMLQRRFELACRRCGLNTEPLKLDTARFRVPQQPQAQLSLFPDR